MRDLIEKTIRNAFKNFRREAREIGGLCACKDLTYKGGNSPDYSNALVQHTYMLRFFPAYLVEYFIMYRNMIDHGFLRGRMKAISFGCGCGVDLWGLFFALKEQAGPPALIDYTGIDVVKWVYQDNLGLDGARFLKQDITAWKTLDEDDYNVFVFPKCIGEFSNDVFESICTMFQKTTFSRRRICGLCSLRDVGKGADIARFTRIASIMRRTHGFQCLDKPNVYWTVKEKEAGLRKVCPPFVYPNEILERVKELLSECPTYNENGDACEEDCHTLNRFPILKAGKVNYNLLRFERH